MVQEEDTIRGGYSQAGRRSLTITRIGQRPHTYKHDMIMTWFQLMKYFFLFSTAEVSHGQYSTL